MTNNLKFEYNRISFSRDLLNENPNHNEDLINVAIPRKILPKGMEMPEEQYLEKWKSGKITLTEWLNNPNNDLKRLQNKKLTKTERDKFLIRQKQLYKWYTEYRLISKLMVLSNVVTRTPNYIEEFVNEEISLLESIIHDYDKKSVILLLKSEDYMNYKEKTIVDSINIIKNPKFKDPFNIHSENGIPEALSLIKYLKILKEHKTGSFSFIQKETFLDESNLIILKKIYFPELVQFLTNLEVNYKYCRNEKDKIAVEQIIIQNVSGQSDHEYFRSRLINLFEFGEDIIYDTLLNKSIIEIREFKQLIIYGFEELKKIICKEKLRISKNKYKKIYRFRNAVYIGNNDRFIALMDMKNDDYLHSEHNYAKALKQSLKHFIIRINAYQPHAALKESNSIKSFSPTEIVDDNWISIKSEIAKHDGNVMGTIKHLFGNSFSPKELRSLTRTTYRRCNDKGVNRNKNFLK